ncbi:hypothetical protein [Mycobacterium sp. IDR2000157661]|uniref:hypothetical protein n=1 Tax=Mycobacterium sp. IDR2000157661 TaxID=2867005 RepID=UPI001EEBECB0|nr:hypothetical protein [Mycobacterium sp. IDR2000157661]ULE34402.1 hypothetical protein K3G64_07145 [Mycobacterium sp. IDR2000157661]
MPVILRKLLRIGGLPDEMRVDIEPEGVLFLAEYVPVMRQFSGKIPGRRSLGKVSSYVGSLALTEQRVLATLSTVPKLAGRTVDHRWDAPQSGAVTAELSRSGLTLEVDINAVDPRFSGTLAMHYKVDIPQEVIDRLPRRSLAFNVSPEYVFRAVGVPYHP